MVLDVFMRIFFLISQNKLIIFGKKNIYIYIFSKFGGNAVMSILSHFSHHASRKCLS